VPHTYIHLITFSARIITTAGIVKPSAFENLVDHPGDALERFG
jgi:hypothetical protein